MFKRFQVSSIAIRSALILSAHVSMGLDASDPCSGRKFCGNLTVVYNGAGENLSDGEDKGVDPAAYDTVQFLDSLASKAKNSKILLLSSDTSPAVAAAVDRARTKMSENFTHIPTSRPSFDGYLNNDAALNALKKSFESDPACQELMKSGEPVSKFLKIDVMVASHSARGAKNKFIGLPVWPNDSGKGEDNKQFEMLLKDENSQKPETFVSAKDFEQFRTVFGEAVFHNVSMSCDAANVGEMIAPLEADTCACFAAYVDRDLVSVRQGESTHGALDASFRAPKGEAWSGATSLTKFSDPLHHYNRWVLMRSSPTGGRGEFASPIFTIETPKANHFDMFAVTSADVYAADIIEETAAPASNDVKVQLTNFTADKEFNGAYKEVEFLIGKNKEQHNQYSSRQVRDPEALKRSREAAKDFYNNCIASPDEENVLCKNFRDILDYVINKQSEDSDFVDVVAMFNKVKDNFRSLADSPILEGKHSDPLSFLAMFRAHSKDFADFRNVFVRVAKKLGRGADVVAALKQMSTKWSTYHSAYIHAYYPDIVGDTLNRRTEALAKAAQLLKDKFNETADPQYKKKLERLRSQLACTLNFPLGPNYKDVNEYPAGSLIVGADKADSDFHVDPKAKPKAKEELPALR